MPKERILICCASGDDAAVGAGGTIAKYSKEGTIVKTLVFSYGELSQLHLKPEIVRAMHIKEAKEADRLLHGKGVEFLGLTEGKFVKEAVQPDMRRRIKAILDREQPTKIFTHSADDPQPGHRAVHKIICSMVKAIKLPCELYSFDVWSPVGFKHRDRPRLVVDISKTFDLKLAAIAAHKSQERIVIGPLLKANVSVKDFLNGFTYGVRYAEVFLKLD